MCGVMDFKDSNMTSFTDFVADLKADHKVQLSLDSLKNAYAINENMLLFSIWYAHREYGRLKKTNIQSLLDSLHPWHERVLASLDDMQTMIKRHSGAHPKADQFKSLLEPILIEADSIEQNLLVESLRGIMSKSKTEKARYNDACANITTYAQAISMRFDTRDIQLLNVILHKVFATLIESDNDALLKVTQTRKAFTANAGSQLKLMV